MSELQIERLQMAADQGATIRGWCQHEGFKVFRKHFEDKINDARESWLTEQDPVKTEALKRKAIIWNEIVMELKKFMSVGDNALRVLTEEFSDVAPDNQDSPQ